MVLKGGKEGNKGLAEGKRAEGPCCRGTRRRDAEGEKVVCS